MRRRAAIGVLLAVGCTRRAAPLPDYGRLPDFELIEHSGRFFRSRDLSGRVWIVDFVFTRCTTVCPRMSGAMRDLQQRLQDIRQAGLLSVSIDPEFDAPPVLASYAARFEARPERWIFLTGEKRLIRAMQESAQRHLDPDEITAHSKQFYLVDGEGYIRGVYSITRPEALGEIVADARRLVTRPERPEPGV